jgi:predicted DNA-binding antitoxin AbrB/MazE fold protein
MQVTTIEGIVENGQIRLTENVKLPESAKVYVVVPNMEKRTAKIMSPRLVNKEDAKYFVKTVEEDVDDEV